MCKGARLKPTSLAVTVGGKNISEVSSMSIDATADFLGRLELSERERQIAERVLKEINERLRFLLDVGLDYLSLSRPTGSLSGGEAQRIRLATQIGSGLVGVLYVLDEPSIGLHQRDNRRLIETLLRLRDLGNTLIVVEHDEETIKAADWAVDIGPGAGEHGGHVVHSGTVEELLSNRESLTGAYLSRRRSIPLPASRRPRTPGREITVHKATEHNLRNITVSFPLGQLIAVTGVSGSGKSTLVNHILYNALAKRIYNAREVPGRHRSITGADEIDKVIHVDQSPIGRTPRSNPATYTGVFDHIRRLFAETPEAKVRGYQPGRFSFNVKGGRCENCTGDGTIKIEMNFLPDVYVPCEVCHGARYNRETLEVHYKGKSIAEVLGLLDRGSTGALRSHCPRLRGTCALWSMWGLGTYDSASRRRPSLVGKRSASSWRANCRSGRRAARVYVLDEPTTGLHFEDIRKLLGVLGRLVDAGNTVVVIEHNLDVIKTADWLIDMGPEGGSRGGLVIAQGTPEQIAANRQVLHRRVPQTLARWPGGAYQSDSAGTRCQLTVRHIEPERPLSRLRSKEHLHSRRQLMTAFEPVHEASGTTRRTVLRAAGVVALAGAGVAALAWLQPRSPPAVRRQRRPPSQRHLNLPPRRRPPSRLPPSRRHRKRRLRKALALPRRRSRSAAASSWRTPTMSSRNQARARTRRSARSALTRDARWPKSATGSFTATATAANTRSRTAR